MITSYDEPCLEIWLNFVVMWLVGVVDYYYCFIATMPQWSTFRNGLTSVTWVLWVYGVMLGKLGDWGGKVVATRSGNVSADIQPQVH